MEYIRENRHKDDMRTMKQKIIFLDFDGVMDTLRYFNILKSQGVKICDKYGSIFDPDCVENLRHIIDTTKAGIVVSSSWKYFMSLKDLKEMWQERDLPGEIVSMTPFDPRNHRGYEIETWLDMQEQEPEYVIIDDLSQEEFNEDQIPHLAIAHPQNGLDQFTANRAIEILNGKK